MIATMNPPDDPTENEEYHASPEELAGVDRGLDDAEHGRFATEEEVEAAFAKFRGA